MNKNELVESTLFFHWGPGANAAMERLWFKNTLSINWWDQPVKFTDPKQAYREVVEASVCELRKMSERAQGKIDILAHSFGGQLAIDVCDSASDLVNSLSLISCSHFAPKCFVYLGKKIASYTKLSDKKLSQTIGDLADVAEKNLAEATFWPLVQAISGVNFLDYYFFDVATKERYFSLLSQGIPMNMEAFADIMSFFLTNGPRTERSSKQTNGDMTVTCLLGTQDPLISINEEEKYWRSVFPACKIEKLQAGHFIHFECPASAWAPKEKVIRRP